VTALAYAPAGQQLFSGGEDSQIVCWDMTVKRKEVCSWLKNFLYQKVNEISCRPPTGLSQTRVNVVVDLSSGM
jgi:hypothetical protein